MAGGIGLKTTVMPFIIRGITLLGINSAGCPYRIRKELWERLAGDWRPRHLDRIAADTIDLDDLSSAFDQLLSGGGKGRIVVRIAVS
jgi:NADPH2:quinone reductase